MSKFKAEYQTFFTSPAGTELLTSISTLVDDNHRQAENKPESARDYMQRSKGNREVLDVINTSLGGSKKPT